MKGDGPIPIGMREARTLSGIDDLYLVCSEPSIPGYQHHALGLSLSD
jgi:hypothetical protein